MTISNRDVLEAADAKAIKNNFKPLTQQVENLIVKFEEITDEFDIVRRNNCYNLIISMLPFYLRGANRNGPYGKQCYTCGSFWHLQNRCYLRRTIQRQHLPLPLPRQRWGPPIYQQRRPQTPHPTVAQRHRFLSGQSTRLQPKKDVEMPSPQMNWSELALTGVSTTNLMSTTTRSNDKQIMDNSKNIKNCVHNGMKCFTPIMNTLISINQCDIAENYMIDENLVQSLFDGGFGLIKNENRNHMQESTFDYSGLASYITKPQMAEEPLTPGLQLIPAVASACSQSSNDKMEDGSDIHRQVAIDEKRKNDIKDPGVALEDDDNDVENDTNDIDEDEADDGVDEVDHEGNDDEISDLSDTDGNDATEEDIQMVEEFKPTPLSLKFALAHNRVQTIMTKGKEAATLKRQRGALKRQLYYLQGIYLVILTLILIIWILHRNFSQNLQVNVRAARARAKTRRKQDIDQNIAIVDGNSCSYLIEKYGRILVFFSRYFYIVDVWMLIFFANFYSSKTVITMTSVN